MPVISRSDARESTRDFEEYLYKLNEEKKQQILTYNEAIIYNVIAGIRYHFLADEGPRYGKVTTKTPIMTRYWLIIFQQKI